MSEKKVNINMFTEEESGKIPVSAPKDLIAHPPDQLQKTFSTIILLTRLYSYYELHF